MDKFEKIKKLGEGVYGCVYQALNKETGETVAIKILKDKVDSRVEYLNLREVKSLKKMKNHPHIVKLIEVFKEFDSLYLVFENMDINLSQLLEDYRGEVLKPDESEVRGWCFQMFKALDYVHKSGYMHRDLKPDNFLVSGVKSGNINIKMADFGMAREVSPGTPYTDGVCTQWYRAPEVLLGSSLPYDSSIDMWSMGAIMGELFNLRPLFPGLSTEIEQVQKICSVIGSPNEDSWAEGLSLADSSNYRFPQYSGIDLSVLIPTASKNAINLISSLCSWDPMKRPTAAEALHHPFFNDCYHNSFSVGNITTDDLLLNEAWLKHKFQMEYSLQLPSYQPPPNLNIPPGYQPLPDLNILPSYQPLPDLNHLPNLNIPPGCQPLPDLNILPSYQPLPDLNHLPSYQPLPDLNVLPTYQPLLDLNKPYNFNFCPQGGASANCLEMLRELRMHKAGNGQGFGYIDYKFLPPSHQKVEAECMHARGGCQWV